MFNGCNGNGDKDDYFERGRLSILDMTIKKWLKYISK